MAQRIEIVRSAYEAWNDRDFETMAALMRDDGVILMMGSGDRFTGPEGVRQYNAMWANGFPDGRLTIDRMMEDGDCVLVEFTGRGTHTGTLEGPQGGIPASGRSVTVQICDVIQFEGDKVRMVHTYTDSASLMMQIGAMPMPGVEAEKMS